MTAVTQEWTHDFGDDREGWLAPRRRGGADMRVAARGEVHLKKAEETQ